MSKEKDMRRIAKFQKVTWEQFREGWLGAFPQTEEEKIREIYDGIRLPIPLIQIYVTEAARLYMRRKAGQAEISIT